STATCWSFPRARFSSPTFFSCRFTIIREHTIRRGHHGSSLPLPRLVPGDRTLSPATVSTACRKGLLTVTISNRQRTIRLCASQTTQLGTCFIAERTTTVAWALHLALSCLLISMCRQTKSWALANLLSSLTASPPLPLPLRWTEDPITR